MVLLVVHRIYVFLLLFSNVIILTMKRVVCRAVSERDIFLLLYFFLQGVYQLSFRGEDSSESSGLATTFIPIL